MKSSKPIIGLVNQYVEIILIIDLDTDFFQRLQILLGYFLGRITLRQILIFTDVVAQFFVLVVPFNVFVLLDYVGINLMPLYHQFERQKVLGFRVDQEDFWPAFARSTGLLGDNKFSPELEKCTSAHWDIAASFGILFEGAFVDQQGWRAVIGT